MTKQLVNIIEFPILYNILEEIKDLFGFDILYYESSKDFLYQLKKNNIENSIIILKKKNDILSGNTSIKNGILVFERLPLKLEKILDKINLSLIKQTYISQSKLNIKNYELDLNSRCIFNKNLFLKLTEKEVQIILFLNKEKSAQSISILQDKVWGYSTKLETHTVETHIYRLRKKIKDNFNDDNFIINFKNGYKI
jgi:DNA-binding response OmpR family regulator|tara:strand:+ start:2654 stop:3241 length:588 start_codon:yes stop_codon:yes gene_type:complete